MKEDTEDDPLFRHYIFRRRRGCPNHPDALVVDRVPANFLEGEVYLQWNHLTRDTQGLYGVMTESTCPECDNYPYPCEYALDTNTLPLYLVIKKLVEPIQKKHGKIGCPNDITGGAKIAQSFKIGEYVC